MDKNEKSFVKKMAYRFDEFISQGIRQQGLLLLMFILCIIIIFSVVSVLLKATTGISEGIWYCFINLLDPGTVSGTDTDNLPLVVLMIIITLIGMIFTGLLISIINNALENRLSMLRQGRRDIIEKNHMIIIGCNNHTYTVIAEQIIANENIHGRMKKEHNPLIIVIDNQGKEQMDSSIQARFTDNKNTRVICRSGEITQHNLYSRIALEKANSIVICCNDDSLSFRVLLALNKYLHQTNQRKPNIVTQMNNKQIYKASMLAMEGTNVNIMYCKELISRVIAQVCRQPGLSYVLQDLFDFSGNEIYIENKDAGGNQLDFDGMLFKDIQQLFVNSTVIGIRRTDDAIRSIMIDPPIDFIMQAADDIIHIAKDDHEIILRQDNDTYEGYELKKEYNRSSTPIMNMLVLDYNEKFPLIMAYLDDFVAPKSTVHLITTYPVINKNDKLKNISLTCEEVEDLATNNRLSELVTKDLTNILLLSDEKYPSDEADINTMIRLLHIREIIRNMEEGQVGTEPKCNIILTSELHNPENQKLMENIKVNDFIVGSEFTNRVLTQVANQPDNCEVFTELLTAYGSEIYLKPADEYITVNSGKSISFAALTKICFEHRDIPIGWMIYHTSGRLIPVINPSKDSTHRFITGEEIIVISQGRQEM